MRPFAAVDNINENRQVTGDGLLWQVKSEDLEALGLIPELIGRLPVIAPLDALGLEDLIHILQSTKGSLIQQFRKLVRFHGADLLFTEAAVKEIAKVALNRGVGARGLRSVVEEQPRLNWLRVPLSQIVFVTVSRRILISRNSPFVVDRDKR